MGTHPFMAEVARAWATEHLGIVAARLGMTQAEYEAALTEELTTFLAGCSLWVRLKPDRLTAFLDSGTLPTFYDAPNLSPTPYDKQRVAVDEILFEGDEITFGHLAPKEAQPLGTVIMYGTINMQLKGVADRTQFMTEDAGVLSPKTRNGVFMDDSEIETELGKLKGYLDRGELAHVVDALSNHDAAPRVSSPITAPSIFSLGWVFEAGRKKYLPCPLTALRTGAFSRQVQTYIEAHIRGKVGLENIASVHFDSEAEYRQFAPRLAALGIEAHDQSHRHRLKEYERIKSELAAQFKLDPHSIHGPAHWENVRHLALFLASVAGGNLKVAQWFALFHDAARVSEGDDPGHGERGAALAEKYRDALELDPAEFQLLQLACTHHEKGKTTLVTTVGACWDADRLELSRVGIQPSRAFMSTPGGMVLASRD